MRGGFPDPSFYARPGLARARAYLRGVVPSPPLSHLVGYRLTQVEPPAPAGGPDVHPAGGTWKDAEVLDVPPAEGPPPHKREIPEPLDPGTSVTPEEERE